VKYGFMYQFAENVGSCFCGKGVSVLTKERQKSRNEGVMSLLIPLHSKSN